MRLKATILLAIAVVLLSVCAEAKTLTLKEAVQTAIKANPEIKAYKATWESAKAKIPQAVSFPDPQIGLEYDQIPSGSRNPEDGMKMYTAEQMIPFPSKIYTDWQIANSLADEASALYRSKALEIISDVKSAYYDLFFLD